MPKPSVSVMFVTLEDIERVIPETLYLMRRASMCRVTLDDKSFEEGIEVDGWAPVLDKKLPGRRAVKRWLTILESNMMREQDLELRQEKPSV